jgi:hypothetical protein
MITYTHIFINSTREMVPLADAPNVVNTVEARAFGFCLVDANLVNFNQHGKPCHRSGGWSYGHIQHGHICAGAGGLNSMPVMAI